MINALSTGRCGARHVFFYGQADQMQLKLFSTLIETLGKVANGLKAIVNLLKAEQRAMRRTLDEIYRLIDTTLNRVIIQPGDLLLLAADEYFLRKGAQLDNA